MTKPYHLRSLRRSLLYRPGYPCLRIFDSGMANAGSGATLDNLHAAAFTAEGWFKILPNWSYQFLFSKNWSYDVGWFLNYNASSQIRAGVHLDTTDPAINYTVSLSRWTHIAITFSHIGDKKIYLWVNGVNVQTSSAGVGATTDDSARNLLLFHTNWSTSGMCGWASWMRIKAEITYLFPFTPEPRWPPPAPSGEVALWYNNEMTGATLTDQSGNANHATLSGSYVWTKS